MKNSLTTVSFVALSIACMAIIGCANTNPPPASTPSAPAAQVAAIASTAPLKPLYSIAAPAAAALNTFAYFYDQDRGDSFFITAPAAKTLFQIGTDEGALLQSIAKTEKRPMSDNAWVRETDGVLFMLNSAHELSVVGVDVFPRSFGMQKLPGLVNPKAFAVAKLTPGYRIAVIDQLPSGDKLKLFRADLKSKTVLDVGDLDLLSVKDPTEVDLGESAPTSLSNNPMQPGFIVSQGKSLRFFDKEGQATEQKPIALKADTLAFDVMACNRGSDKGYWIALQKTEAGYQIELLRRLSFESLGAVSLASVKSASDMRFMGRATKYLPNGGVFMIADDKFTTYNWHDVAAALGARKMCF